MTKGRQPLEDGACTITVILTIPQRKALEERAMKRRRELQRFVSTSEIIREAVNLYFAADSFFRKELA